MNEEMKEIIKVRVSTSGKDFIYIGEKKGETKYFIQLKDRKIGLIEINKLDIITSSIVEG